MKILYLTRENIPSFRADIAVLFGKYLPALGIFSDITARCSMSEPPSWQGGRAWACHGTGKIGRLLAYIWAAVRLLWLAGDKDYDVIQVRDRTFGAIAAIIAARWHKKSFTYWMSYPFAEYWVRLASSEETSSFSSFKKTFYYVRGVCSLWLLKNCILPNANFVFAQSDNMVDYLAAYGYPREQMLAVPMGVDEAISVESHERIPELQGKQVLLYLGALERNRHPEIMLDALSILREEFPLVRLLLVGASQNAAENEWLSQQIEIRGLAELIYRTGWVKSEQVPYYAGMADVGLSPCPRSFTLDMGSPTKAAEYMKYRLAMVVTDNPDQAHLVSLCQSGLCTPFAAEPFAAATAHLLRNSELCHQYGQQGHDAVMSHRSYQQIAAQVALRYQQIVP